ncbi:NAD-binding protein [Rhodococcus opacus]|nr:NAD-binding protein [Rhodococcus opacus]
MHRLRCLRAGVPPRGHLPRGRSARRESARRGTSARCIRRAGPARWRPQIRKAPQSRRGQEMSAPTVGFIGAGNIGEPMVERLLSAGSVTTVFARRPEVRSRLAERGALLAEAPEDLAGSDIVATCLFTDQQVLDLCPPIIEGMRPGSVFVSHTTGSPETIRRLDAVARRRDVSVVEAPFSGTPEAVRRTQLTVMLAGDDAAVDVAEDTIAAYASNIIRTGRLGTALPAKLLNNALFAVCTQLTLSAIETAQSLGISEKTLLDVLAVSSGGSAAARYIAASGKGAQAYSANLPRYLSKDLVSVRAVAAELGADISSLWAAAQLGPMDLTDNDTAVGQFQSSAT